MADDNDLASVARWVRLPLMPGTAACLTCEWTATGRTVALAATNHSRATRHPTVAAPRIEIQSPGNSGPGF